ncbi:hypothetical protein BT96DRAFT_594949 [Gymnopus androsaceus JB14]|uniref:Uncharacterized protein n=1 Tax=Gymnopus androsaceus JB14 TaxID=1447944 RepID=A0A6A4GIZ1_9AGAR|nr:hypothetical protein BT96DRAFT_594949 [Gymnopus androsaceus JB14]
MHSIHCFSTPPSVKSALAHARVPLPRHTASLILGMRTDDGLPFKTWDMAAESRVSNLAIVPTRTKHFSPTMFTLALPPQTTICYSTPTHHAPAISHPVLIFLHTMVIMQRSRNQRWRRVVLGSLYLSNGLFLAISLIST